MIYYVDGNFSSRKAIEVGSVTLHPSGPAARAAAGARREVARDDGDARARGDVRHVPSASADDARGATSTTASTPTRGTTIRRRTARTPDEDPGRRHLAPLTLLALPAPYDFEHSTERFRAFGIDLANLWHEGGLHRVVGGREVRIEAAPGGVDVEPLDDETRPVVETCSASGSSSSRSTRGRPASRCSRELVPRLAGFRPPLAPDPFETLVTSITAQQVSLFSAFAIRNRMIERFGERAGHAYAVPDARAGRRGARGGARRASGSRAARPST